MALAVVAHSLLLVADVRRTTQDHLDNVTLLGMNASDMSKLMHAQQMDAVEKVVGMPFYCGIQVVINDNGADVLKLGHSFICLPVSELYC